MILKTNLHFHTSEDPLDLFIKYDIYQGIREAKKKCFKVLALTCHDEFVYKEEYGQYAKEQGILLIPGVEIEIKRGHVIILNADKEAEKIRSFAALKRYKEKNKKAFVIAPHPYFGMFSLNGKLKRNIKIFDAIEANWFFTFSFDRNKKAREIAKKHKKPYIASSDTHNIKNLNKSYALIDSSEFNTEAVLNSIRDGRFKNVMNSLSWFSAIGYLIWYNFSQLKVLINGIIGNKGRINIRIPFLDRNNFAIKRGALLAVLFLGLAFYLIVN